MLSTTFPYVNYSTFFFFFHLKQVQYPTTPSNLDSLEGGAGEGRWVGVLKEGVWRRREDKHVMSSKEPLPCRSFSISYAWLFIFSRWWSLSPQMVCPDVVFHSTPGPPCRLHPLAKRRTYWLSWTSENKSKHRRWNWCTCLKRRLCRGEWRYLGPISGLLCTFKAQEGGAL